MSATVRVLGPGDEATLDAFLLRHADSSMFLRADSKAGGLVDRGEAPQGTYAAAFDDLGRLIGVAGHFWNGMVLLQVPAPATELLGVLVRLAVTRSRGRRVAGFGGPYAQTIAARAALGLGAAPAALDSRDDLFPLELIALHVPPRLASGAWSARPPREGEMDLVSAWRVAYRVELLGATPGAELEASSRRDVEHGRASGNSWLLFDDGQPVAYTGFNARLPDVVQVAGLHAASAARPRIRARRGRRVAAPGTRGWGAPRHPVHRQQQRACARRVPGAGLPDRRRLRPRAAAHVTATDVS